MLRLTKQLGSSSTRRSFLRSGLAAPAVIGASMAAASISTAAFAEDDDGPTRGDISILRFLAALEILETDLWEQYNELGGLRDPEEPSGSGNKPYADLLAKIDGDMSQYIHDNTEDEFTHFNFINEYLKSKRAPPVNLERFRTLHGSIAEGSSGKKRLTNLMNLTVDASWWGRYRSRDANPDLGDTNFANPVPGLLKGKFPAIPRSNDDTKDAEASARDRQHGRIPFRHDRAGRQQPLSLPGAARIERGGAAHIAQHRSDGNDAFPSVARQGWQHHEGD